MKCRIAVLISDTGAGTNLQAIIDGVKSGKIKAEIAAVVSDTPKAPGLARAAKYKLPIKIVPKKEKLLEVLKKLNPDYICLAGWKQIILDEIIKAFPNKILNLHPGLIPENMKEQVLNPDGSKGLWNRGKLTDQAVQVFLDDKSTYAGSSIHFLSAEFDFGPVLGRCFEKIKKGDTVDSLYKRLKIKENKLYADVLSKLTRSVVLGTSIALSVNSAKDLSILVIGQNGREHALAVAYAKSKRVKKVIMTPGNGLTDFDNSKIKNYPNVGMMDFDGIVKVCKKEKIDLVDVGQDDIIASGYVDKLESLGIRAFGPSRLAAEIEWNKVWARTFMQKYGLPIPVFAHFTNEKEAIKYVNTLPDQLLYIKAAGLAAGKGAIRAENKQEAEAAILSMKQFGKSGKEFVIEEGMIGEEFSLFAICDGKDFKILSYAQDHKRVYDGDTGPNTGGVGCVAPAGVINVSIIRIIDTRIIRPLLEGMTQEGRPYRGILYLGGIVTKDGIKIIEFNARWGDPEAEVILPSIKTDYLTITESILNGKLNNLKIKMDNKVRISVAGCSKGYPGDYSKVRGKEVFGIPQAMKLSGITIFGAGINRFGNRFFATGGRVFHVVGEGKNVLEARAKAYSAMSLISIEGDNLHYRTDIGWRDVERMRIK